MDNEPITLKEFADRLNAAFTEAMNGDDTNVEVNVGILHQWRRRGILESYKDKRFNRIMTTECPEDGKYIMRLMASIGHYNRSVK